MNAKTCPICRAQAVSPHHIIPRSEGGTNRSRNIVWLCKRCHDKVEELYYEASMIYAPNVIRLIQDELGIDKPVKDTVSRRFGFREKSYLSEFDTLRTKLKRHKESTRVLLVLHPSEGGKRTICGRCGQEFFCHDNRFSMCARCRKLLAVQLSLPIKISFKKILGYVTNEVLATESCLLSECYLQDGRFFFMRNIRPSEALESLTYGYYLKASDR